MSNQVYGEIDFLEHMSSQEEKRKKAEELRQQAKEELAQIEAKYQEVLEEYRPASERIKNLVNAFNDEWEPKMCNYQKEVKALKNKYNKLIKSL